MRTFKLLAALLLMALLLVGLVPAMASSTLEATYEIPVYIKTFDCESEEDYFEFDISLREELRKNGLKDTFEAQSGHDENFTYEWKLSEDASALFAEKMADNHTDYSRIFANSTGPHSVEMENKLKGQTFLSLVVTNGTTPVTTFNFVVQDYIPCIYEDRSVSGIRYVTFTPNQQINLTVPDTVYAPDVDVVYSWEIVGNDGPMSSGTGKTVTFTPTQDYDMANVAWSVCRADVAERFGEQSADFTSNVSPRYCLQSSESAHIQLPEIGRSFYEMLLYHGESYTMKLPEAQPAVGSEDRELEYNIYGFVRFGDVNKQIDVWTDKPEYTVTNENVTENVSYAYTISVCYKGARDNLIEYPTVFRFYMKPEEKIINVDDPKPVSNVGGDLTNAILDQHGITVGTPGQMENLMLTTLETDINTDMNDTADGTIGNQLLNVEVKIVDEATGKERTVTVDDFTEMGEIYTIIPWMDGVPEYVENCEYLVTHMYDKDGNGHKAGEIEVLAPAFVDLRGIHVNLEGASPMMVSWVKADATLTAPQPNTTTPPVTPTPTPAAPAETTTVPATGDSTPIALLIGLMALSLLVVGTQIRRKA